MRLSLSYPTKPLNASNQVLVWQKVASPNAVFNGNPAELQARRQGKSSAHTVGMAAQATKRVMITASDPHVFLRARTRDMLPLRASSRCTSAFWERIVALMRCVSRRGSQTLSAISAGLAL